MAPNKIFADGRFITDESDSDKSRIFHKLILLKEQRTFLVILQR